MAIGGYTLLLATDAPERLFTHRLDGLLVRGGVQRRESANHSQLAAAACVAQAPGRL